MLPQLQDIVEIRTKLNEVWIYTKQDDEPHIIDKKHITEDEIILIEKFTIYYQ